MSPEELAKKVAEARRRDAESVSTWFKEPAVGACGQAFIDRRRLLKHIDQLLLRLIRINAINDNPARFDKEIDRLSTVLQADRPAPDVGLQ